MAWCAEHAMPYTAESVHHHIAVFASCHAFVFVSHDVYSA